MKRVLGMILALMMIVSIPAAAFADTYDIANGDINVFANDEGQTVSQTQWTQDAETGDYNPTVIIDNKPDSAPVITGSSDENGIGIHSTEGSEANVTLQNVDGAYLTVGGAEVYKDGTYTSSVGDATITVEGSNTFNSTTVTWTDPDGQTGTYTSGGYVRIDNGTTTLKGSGSLTADAGININAPEVIIDGPDITGEGSGCGVGIYGSNYQYDAESDSWKPNSFSSVTVENGSLTGIATGYEEDPNHPLPDDKINTAGIRVNEGSSLTVNGGTVTGINGSIGQTGLNPGIGFVEGAKLNVGEGIKVYDANGKDVTAAAVADPTVLNDSAKTTIKAQPAVINRMIAGTALQEIETVVKDADGNEVEAKVIVEIYQNRFVKVTVRTANGFYTELCGRATLKDGALVFLFSGVEYTLTADNVLVLPLRNGGTVEVKLTDEVLEIIRGLF